MIPAKPDPLDGSAREVAGELFRWRPAQGLLSVYLDADPADRRAGWRIELKNSLEAIVAGAEEGDDRDLRLALRATAERLLTELAGRDEIEPRGLIGFVEVSRKEAEQRWYSTQLPPSRSVAVHGPRAHLHPLMELIDDGAPLGIALASSERVRLLDWRFGRIRQLHAWELEMFAKDWRERKAERPDTSRGTAVSSAGRDQYDQRLEANRERFAHQTGSLMTAEAREHGWRTLLLFGDERYAGQVAGGFNGACELRRVDSSDLISEPTPAVERRVEPAIAEFNRDREQALIARVKEAAFAEGRSALGPQETAQSLAEGRVDHLLYDAGREWDLTTLQLDGLDSPEMPLADWMIERALSTGAAVTPVEGEGAKSLEEQDGVAALLRYSDAHAVENARIAGADFDSGDRIFPASSRVIVGCDPSDRGRDALLLGELLARTIGAGLVVARALDGSGALEQATRELREEVESLLPPKAPEPELALMAGSSPVPALLELSERAGEGALVVLGSTHRAGLGRVMPGSVATRLLGQVRFPLAIAPRGYARARAGSEGEAGATPPGPPALPLVREELRVIAVGFDGSAESADALAAAAELGERARATLRLIAVMPSLHAAETREATAMIPAEVPGEGLEELLHETAARLPGELRVLPVFLKGDPAAELLAAAEVGVDLLVVGSRRQGALRRVWLGGVSSRLINEAACPVMVMPRPGAQPKR